MSASLLNIVDGWSQQDCDATEVVPVEWSATARGWATAATGWESSLSGDLYIAQCLQKVIGSRVNKFSENTIFSKITIIQVLYWLFWSSLGSFPVWSEEESCWRMRDESSCSVICTRFKITFLGKWDESWERPFLWPLTSSPDCNTYSVHSVHY